MKKSKSSKSATVNENADGNEDFLIVGIGASAGGVQALKDFFENVSADSGAAYVVILHLSPDHDSLLAEILQSVAPIPVAQIAERVRVEPNHVYVVSPNQHLEMNDGHIVVSPNVSVEERRAPIDIFFRTLAESHDSRAVAVVLSGTGADGSMGIKRIKERFGAAFVQNPREAEFSEMPRHSIATKLIDQVLNVREIPAKIAVYKANRGAVEIAVQTESRPEDDQSALREIFTVLRVQTKHDFSEYKRATILRRIERHINVRELPSLPAYAAYVKENPDEAKSLLKDLLISVTNFFRDKEAFRFLEHDVLTRILHGKSGGDQVRVWVAGCATGEEAYGLAMLLVEQIEKSPTNVPAIQIFATDIDDAALAAAREGFYTLNDAADVPPKRLRRFFTKDGDGFRVRKELREMILFANHNLLKDPPFSRLDLVTCRNLLIYFNGAAQERAIETFHFALNPGCYLFLGASENINGASDLYASVNKEHRVFQSRQAAARIAYRVPEASSLTRFVAPKIAPATVLQEWESYRLERISFGDLHQQMLEQYAPPSIVIDENFDIVHLSERAGRFLQIAGGEPSKSILQLIRPELRLELRTALYQAVQRRTNTVTANLNVLANGRAETINIQVRPVLGVEDTARGFLLVIFESLPDGVAAAEQIVALDEPLARRLEDELERTKRQLHTSVEQFEAQTEELRASNEELQAINEELRSTAEELETSREELQSVNEELLTVNQELKIKVEELSASNSDFQNLLSSTDIGTIFLDRNLRIKMFTPTALEIFNLISSDLNRPLADITTKINFTGLETDIKKVFNTLQTVEREVETDDGKWYLLRVFPYRTTEDHISGAVITSIEITNRIRSEQALREIAQSREQQTRVFDTALSSIADFVYTFDGAGRFTYANQPLLDLLGITLEKITGKTFGELAYPKILADKLQTQIEQVFKTHKSVTDETPFVNPAGEQGFYEYIFAPVVGENGAVEVVAGSTRVITERRQAEEKLRESETQMRLVVEAAEMGTWDWNLITGAVRWNDQHFRLFGREPENRVLDYKDFESGVHPDDREMVREQLEQAIKQHKVFQTEFRVVLPAGATRWMSGYGRVVERDENDCAVRLTGVMFDATERRAAEESVRESKERLQLLIESATDYAIFTVTPDNVVDSWNAGAEKVFGWQEQEIIGKSGAVLFTPEDRAQNVPEREIKTAAKKGCAEDERWHIRRDDSRFYASGVMRPLKDGKQKGFVKIARDMTDKIEAENDLREKQFLQRMVRAQEEERKRIARDLHDHLGQQLTALRLQLETARKICETDAELLAKIDETQMIAKRIDADVDFLAWELRPAALDDLGLIAALENYVNEWSHHSGVTTEFFASGLHKERFPPEVEINLYRITQEALNNIYKHAAAGRASIILEKRAGLLVLIVEDDGVGLDTKNRATRHGGLGLTGMEERAALIGGTQEIESAKGTGTTIYVRVPLDETMKNKKPRKKVRK